MAFTLVIVTMQMALRRLEATLHMAFTTLKMTFRVVMVMMQMALRTHKLQLCRWI